MARRSVDSGGGVNELSWVVLLTAWWIIDSDRLVSGGVIPLALLIRVLICAVLGLVAWKLIQPRRRIRIVVDQDGVKSHHGLPDGRQNIILNFIARTVIMDRRVVIGLSRVSEGRPRLHFPGPIDSDTRQLVRNFLLSEL